MLYFHKSLRQNCDPKIAQLHINPITYEPVQSRNLKKLNQIKLIKLIKNLK